MLCSVSEGLSLLDTSWPISSSVSRSDGLVAIGVCAGEQDHCPEPTARILARNLTSHKITATSMLAKYLDPTLLYLSRSVTRIPKKPVTRCRRVTYVCAARSRRSGPPVAHVRSHELRTCGRQGQV